MFRAAQWQSFSLSAFLDLCRKSRQDSPGTSLVVLCLRIHLLMQGTRIQSLVWEDSTCSGASKPVHPSY